MERKIRVFAWPAKGINPYNELLYAEIRKLGIEVVDYTHRRAFIQRFDILHCHWPQYVLHPPQFWEAFVRMALLFLRFSYYKLRGVKIVWTAHDLAPMESKHFGLLKLYCQCFPLFLDGVVYLSSCTERSFGEFFSLRAALKSVLARHGDYQNAYPHSADKGICRERLKLASEGDVYCFCGLIRPYKNVPYLIRTFRQLENPEATLIVAGDPSPNSQRPELESLAADDPRVLLKFAYIQEENFQEYIRPADLVVLPFRKIYNSGSVLLSLSMGRPVLVPDIPIFRELKELVGEDWVRLFEGELTSRCLSEGMDWAKKTVRSNYPDFSRMSWAKAAESHYELYKSVLSI